MTNSHLTKRLLAVREQLMAVHAGGQSLSSSTKGSEREHFIDIFLSAVLPPIYRFGSGDITNAHGAKSGQLDVVVELPHLPSIPMVVGKQRLYLAESVAAAIEVKSDIGGQWEEALGTAGKLASVTRNVQNYEFASAIGRIRRVAGRYHLDGLEVPEWRPPSHREAKGWIEIDEATGRATVVGVEDRPERVPLFAVGYKGWATLDGLAGHIEDAEIDGVLVLDSLLFASPQRCGAIRAEGAAALWAFICAIHDATRQLEKVQFDPRSYCYPDGWESGSPPFPIPDYGIYFIPRPTPQEGSIGGAASANLLPAISVVQPEPTEAQMVFTGQIFENQPVEIDGNQYDKCVFNRCIMRTAGGQSELSNCEMNDCSWELYGAAGRTIGTLRTLWAQGGFTRQMVESVIDRMIRQEDTQPR